MAEFAAPIPTPRSDARPRGSGGGGDNLVLPSLSRQGQRIGPTFQRLRDFLGEARPGIRYGMIPPALRRSVQLYLRSRGLSEIFTRPFSKSRPRIFGDEELEFEADEDFAALDTRRERTGQRREDKAVGGRLYLAMPDTRALRELLRLWDLYQAGRPAARGFAPWYNLFGQLRALRAWGPIDRIPEETIDYWEAKLERAEADLLIRTEVELWSFATTHRQREASEQFEATVAEAGGTIIDRASIVKSATKVLLSTCQQER